MFSCDLSCGAPRCRLRDLEVQGLPIHVSVAKS